MNKYKKNRRNNRNKRNKKKKNTWASEYKQLHQGWSWCLWISRTWDRECEGIQHDLFQVCRPPVASLLPSGDQARLHTCKKQRLKQKNRKQSGPNTNQMVAQLLAPSMQVNRAGSTQFAWFLGRIITGKPVLTCERYSASVASSSLQWGRSTQTIQKSARTSSPSSQRRTVPSALVEASSKSSGE